MVGWHYILAITFLSIYISAWLGVEIIADSRKYKVTHLQMSIIPLICILAIPFMGYNNYSTTIIPIASRFYKKKRVHIFLTITIRKFIIWEYLIYQGKMPLCLFLLETYSLNVLPNILNEHIYVRRLVLSVLNPYQIVCRNISI